MSANAANLSSTHPRQDSAAATWALDSSWYESYYIGMATRLPTARTPSRASSPGHLTELEGVVVGIVHRDGPCTAYEIRRLLAVSPSSQWSASAGAVYPSVRKLLRLGLLRAIAHPNRSNGTRYVATPKGVAALLAWIGPPFNDTVRTVSHDPLRSRAAMLALVSPDKRRDWIAAALRMLDDVEAAVARWHDERRGDPVSELLSAAGNADVAARREWLRRASKILSRRSKENA